MKICITCNEKLDDYLFKNNSFKCKNCISKYQKEYRLKNKEKTKIYQDEYYKNNKGKILSNVIAYNSINKLKVQSYKTEYYKNNKIKLKEYHKEYYINNKERMDNSNRAYYLNNRERINILRKNRLIKNREIINKKYRQKRINDSLFRLKENIRAYIRYSLRSNGVKKDTMTEQILGCSYFDFKIYLESKFESWMTWGNYGIYNGNYDYGWDIDHIIPLSSAKSVKDIIKLNHFSNLQPLCSKINRYIKKDKL